MIEKVDFANLTTRALQDSDQWQLRPVIEKELLHYDILFGLDRAGLLEGLTFQGGTALRLCYGSTRLSEDLDFAGGRDFSKTNLMGIKECLQDYVGHRYGLAVEVKDPKPPKSEAKSKMGPSVSTWQLSIITAPARPDIPRQRIKFQVANVPSYSAVPRALNINYDFLPDGYGDTLIMTETLEELMADKLVSLVNSNRFIEDASIESGFIRYRDIWDLRWLQQKGAKPNLEWVANKVRDYGIQNYPEKVSGLRSQLPSIIRGDRFRQEMTRFLSQDAIGRTFDRPAFSDFLVAQIDELLLPLESLSSSRGL